MTVLKEKRISKFNYMKREANFQTIFSHWLKSVHKQTGVFELKQTKTDSLPFSAVLPHQLQALENVRHGIFVFKIPDAGYQNPFDCFSLFQQPAFVVIKYPKSFEVISIDAFLLEKERSKRKSLTWDRAKQISIISEIIYTSPSRIDHQPKQ